MYRTYNHYNISHFYIKLHEYLFIYVVLTFYFCVNCLYLFPLKFLLWFVISLNNKN